MNIKDQTNHIIYYNNLKLAEIRANIEEQMKRVDGEVFCHSGENLFDPELLEMRVSLEEIYEKLL